ncbi:hypothetical protein B0H34DRAFT_807312 [Crassisporium funariophilum]|nr:hypothetical protein B0H34DRAFT_807312 [Crassisporium funariophilum]
MYSQNAVHIKAFLNSSKDRPQSKVGCQINIESNYQKAGESRSINAMRADGGNLEADMAPYVWDKNKFDSILPVQALPQLPYGNCNNFSALAIATIVYNILDMPAGCLPVTHIDPEKDQLTEEWVNGPGLGSAVLEAGVHSGKIPAIVGKKWEEEKVLAVMGIVDKALGKRVLGCAHEEFRIVASWKKIKQRLYKHGLQSVDGLNMSMFLACTQATWVRVNRAAVVVERTVWAWWRLEKIIGASWMGCGSFRVLPALFIGWRVKPDEANQLAFETQDIKDALIPFKRLLHAVGVLQDDGYGSGEGQVGEGEGAGGGGPLVVPYGV